MTKKKRKDTSVTLRVNQLLDRNTPHIVTTKQSKKYNAKKVNSENIDSDKVSDEYYQDNYDGDCE